MAERPIFVPSVDSRRLVDVIPVEFHWHAGFAPIQKKRNVEAIHAIAAKKGISPVLEVSTKSTIQEGFELSAFCLSTRLEGIQATIECLFQGSKVFEKGGPYNDLYYVDSRSAKRDYRIKNSGRLISFALGDDVYPIEPKTIFYDWIYINAIHSNDHLIWAIKKCAGFTDIEFNPEKSLNCQARSCALYHSLKARDIVEDAIESFGKFYDILRSYDY